MKFVFDLDGTLTKCETLPLIASRFKVTEELAILTDKTIRGDVPFLESFIRRVDILSSIDPDEVARFLCDVPLNLHLFSFILENSADCIIATGNYRGWVKNLCDQFNCEYRCSEGSVIDGRVKLSQILLKEDLVKELKDRGEFVVFIGDGNNDAEAMRLADIGIACGIVHRPANILMQLCDFAIYDDETLCRFLRQIKSEHPGQTVVISCAGIGSRLGLGKTKALVEIHGSPILTHLIDYFSEICDLRIVVGFQASDVIELALKHRKNIIFAFNHNYFHTKTGASVSLGARFCLDYVLAWDGDFVAKASDVKKIIERESEFVCCTQPTSSDPIYVITDHTQLNALGFSKVHGKLEWSGPAKIKRANISYNDGNTYDLLAPLLPLPIFEIRGTDIDTYSDYLRLPTLLKEWNDTNESADVFYRKLANSIVNPIETRNKSPDFTHFDIAFVRPFGRDSNANLLELGAGTGLMTNALCKYFANIVAVEKYAEFAKFIDRRSNVNVIIDDLLHFKPEEHFDVITLFGVMNFFNKSEAQFIYKLAFDALKEDGVLLVKHNMGILEDVYINNFSQELNTYYYSTYRSKINEKLLVSEAGFSVEKCVDIYPQKFNRHANTHFYAFVCKKTRESI